MFKILVVSDSHGNSELLREIVTQNSGCELVIHLGDNAADATEVMRDFPAKASLSVLGNCDMGFFLDKLNFDGTFSVEERRIFYTHGHRYNASVDMMVAQAKMKKADIVLYGHTHVSFAEEIRGVLVINPGSISLPRDGTGGTYCVMEIDGSNVKYEIKEVEK